MEQGERIGVVARWRRHRAGFAGALVALVMFVWGWWVARDQSLPVWERELFEAINGLPDWLRAPLWPVMQLGNGALWFLAPALSLLVWRRSRVALAIFVATFGGWAGAKVVKHVVERPRPEELLDSLNLRDHTQGFGFISGHTTIAFALATVLMPYLTPTGRRVAVALAGLVGVARVYFGAHLPVDVIGGAGFGILCGLGATAVVGVETTVARSGRHTATTH